MRDAVIDRQFQHLGVNQDHPAGFRRVAIEERQDHRIDTHRLARTGGAGDEKMRHLRQIDDHRRAGDVLAERHGQVAAVGLPDGMIQYLAEDDDLPVCVGKLDADDVLPRHHSHAHRHRAHRPGDVVSQRDHPLRFRPGGGFEVMARHHRAVSGLRDFPFDTKVPENGLELHSRGLELLLRQAGGRLSGRLQQLRRRQAELAVTTEIKPPLTSGRSSRRGCVAAGIDDCRLLPLLLAGSLAGPFLGHRFACLGNGLARLRQFKRRRVFAAILRLGAARPQHPADQPCQHPDRHHKQRPLAARESGAPGPEHKAEQRVSGAKIMRQSKTEDGRHRRHMRHGQAEEHHTSGTACGTAGTARQAIDTAGEKKQRDRRQKQPCHALADFLLAQQAITPAKGKKRGEEARRTEAGAKATGNGGPDRAEPVVDGAGGKGAPGRVKATGRKQHRRQGTPGQDQQKPARLHRPPAQKAHQRR